MASVMHPSSQEENLYEDRSPMPSFMNQYDTTNLYRSTVDCKQALRRAKKGRRYTVSESGTSRAFMSSIDNILEDLEEKMDANEILKMNSGKLPCGKNIRKSRNGFRCKSKKSDTNGRVMMTKLGAEMANLMLEDLDFDKEDPIYDSEVEENVHWVKSQPKPASFDKRVEVCLKEFYEHGLVDEVMLVLDEGSFTAKQRSELLYLAILLAMERRPRHCEMTSRLLAASTGKYLTQADVERGFDKFLVDLADVSLDVPAAPEILGRFIARAVADDVLPPKYVHSYKGRLSCPYAVRSLAEAENLLMMKHAYTRLDNVWGLGGAHMPTKLLHKRVKLLLEEFVSSNDKDEATMCVRELDVPHYHHEVVYQAVMMVLDKGTTEVCKRISRLLGYWANAMIVSEDQISLGFRRIYDDLADISLDIPNAQTYLEHLLKNCQQFLSKKLIHEMPDRPRKRFVSEGDPALFKGFSLLRH